MPCYCESQHPDSTQRRPRDFYHTCYTLSGMSSAQYQWLGDLTKVGAAGAKQCVLELTSIAHFVCRLWHSFRTTKTAFFARPTRPTMSSFPRYVAAICLHQLRDSRLFLLPRL